MKSSFLIVNEFLGGEKYESTTRLFFESAKKFDIDLKAVTNAELIVLPESFPDFAILWDKDYCVGKRLEKAGLRLFNCADAVSVCDNKAYTYLALDGICKMPKTLIAPMTFSNIGYTNTDFVTQAVEILGLPVVIKEVYGSFGQQVYLAKSVGQAKEILTKIGSKGAILQEFIKESYGVDLRLNVVGDKVVSAMKRTGEGFVSNISSGGKAENYTPTDEETELALKATHNLGLDFAGVDLLIGNNGPVLCEVNSNLQFRSAYDVTGINLADNIFEYITECL